MKIWVPIIKLKAIEIGGTKHTPKFTEGQPLHRRPAKKRHAKLISLVALFTVISASLIWLAVRGLNAPAEGTIDNSGGSISSRHALSNGNYSDSFLSFEYRGSYKVVSPEKSASYLDNIALLSNDHPAIYVAMGLVKESIANDSGLNYRQLHPELYKLVSATADSKVFSRGQPSPEYTGFISHSDMVVSISLTSVSPTNLAEDYATIASNLNWRQ